VAFWPFEVGGRVLVENFAANFYIKFKPFFRKKSIPQEKLLKKKKSSG